MEAADFSGYATKAGLKCSDGRTIMPEAFQHMHGKMVPLVWQHDHKDHANVLGHAILEAREDGVYAYGFFNDTPQGKNAKTLVQHKDITSLSIYANKLVERSKQVFHGMIRELSLVLSGANPGAVIENVSIAHSYGDVETLEEEAIIYTGLTLEHSDSESFLDGRDEDEDEDEDLEHADETTVKDVYDSFSDEEKEVVNYMIGAAVEAAEGKVSHADGGEDETIEDVYNSMSEKQKNVVNYMIGAALEAAQAESAKHSDNNEDNLAHKEGNEMTRNLFEQNGLGTKDDGPSLSHDDMKQVFTGAEETGSLKKAMEAYALSHGITDIDLLFPDAKMVSDRPDLIARRTEWVKGVIEGARHTPFSRIKSMAFDVTAEEARAKGYVKGNLKKEEIIKLLKRVTTPTTVYKKQKLDRDDIIDITDFDVVAYLKWELRFMIEEEIARAILIGDGREPDDDDKINEDNLRPIAWDDEMYAHSVSVPSNTSPEGIVESVLRSRKFYKGTGTPTFYTTDDILTDMILLKDKVGRRLYNTEAELAAALRVKEIVVVEVMEDTPDLLGVIVNMTDYTIGADKGGQLSMFDDFDIDYNQHKYLIETRISGCLTKPKSAVVIKRTSGTTVQPAVPGFDEATNTLTVPTVAGVSYFNVTDPLNEVELVDGAAVVITETTDVEARPDAGYNFPHNTDADWTFAYTA